MALHMRIFASGSSFTIARTASMPPMSGITMSIVTRSGLSCRYFSTAWAPVSVGGGLGLPQRPPPFHHGDEGAPHVDHARHHGWRPGNPRRVEPRQDLADPLRLGGADEAAHSKQEQSDDSRVTHPKRRSQDTARGCVEQANSHRRLLLLALERDQQASPSAG